MIDRSKKLPARFYINHTGAILSANGYWSCLPPIAIRGQDIQKVEFGWPIGRPHCAPLGTACGGAERSRQQPDCAVMLLHGRRHMNSLAWLYQEDAKDAEADIDLALKRKREVT